MAAFSGQEVIVVGAGQSAVESAALLHENGAAVQLLARKPTLAWNSEPILGDRSDRSLLERLRTPQAGLGDGSRLWFYSNCPDLFRRLPRNVRVEKARTVLGPAGGFWVRSRGEGQFPTPVAHPVPSAAPRGARVRPEVDTHDSAHRG